MAFPTPPTLEQPIPNAPFYYPLTNYLKGEYGPLIVGAGIHVDSLTGTISAGGAGPGGISSILPGSGIFVSPNTGGIVTVTNTGILSLTAGVGINISGSGGNLTITNTNPAPFSPGTVTQINAGTGLTGGPITTTGTISLAPSGVAAGTYVNPTVTVDQYGRITLASPGSPLASVGLLASAPLQITTGAFPQTVSISAASTTTSGAVRLNDSVSSTSVTEAATPRAVKQTYDLANSGAANASTALTSATSALTAANNSLGIANTAQACALQALTNVAVAQGDATQALSDSATAQTTANTALTTAVNGQNAAATALSSANARIPCSAFLGKGNLLAGTSAGSYTSLPSGTDGQFLVANSSAPSGLTWVANPVNSLITNKGDIIIGVSAGTAGNLSAGANGFVLTACSTCAGGLFWSPLPTPASIPCSCLTAKGTLVAGDGVSSPTALPVGADAQVLRPNSACASGLEWSEVGKSVSSITNDLGSLVMDNLQFRMNSAGQHFEVALVSGAETVTWANSGVESASYAAAQVCTDVPMTTTWVALCGGYAFASHGSTQSAILCYGSPVRCAYDFKGIVGFGYNDNVMCITRIV